MDSGIPEKTNFWQNLANAFKLLKDIDYQ